MKKYKLLKDLPRAKAGEIVIITNAHSNTAGILKINKWNEDETQRPRLAFIHTKNVDEWLEEIKETKSVWDLCIGDNFYFLSSQGDVVECVLTDSCTDSASRLNGNTFLTIEEAEKERDRRQAIAKILKYCYENNIDNSWKENDYEVRYYFCLSLEEEKVEFFYPRDDQKPYSPIGYFSWNDAKKILKTFPKELKSIYS
ncbi:hypothetical protein BLM37_03235 [Candidatus Gracilibacteria bacterium GN02-873]|nr:hypothetical protein BLM37_03235 [Candidatus Gracilibacteria bacterium GN02-873]